MPGTHGWKNSGVRGTLTAHRTHADATTYSPCHQRHFLPARAISGSARARARPRPFRRTRAQSSAPAPERGSGPRITQNSAPGQAQAPQKHSFGAVCNYKADAFCPPAPESARLFRGGVLLYIYEVYIEEHELPAWAGQMYLTPFCSFRENFPPRPPRALRHSLLEKYQRRSPRPAAARSRPRAWKSYRNCTTLDTDPPGCPTFR